MKIKDLRLHLMVSYWLQQIVLQDQDDFEVCSVFWGSGLRTKPQATAIAKRLCYRFNAGQGGK